MEPIFEKLNKKKNCTIVIAGDLNQNLLKINQNAEIGDVFDEFCGNGFFPSICLPTRFAKKSASIIDQIFIKHQYFENMSKSLSGIWLKHISDHKMVFSCLNVFIPKPNNIPKFVMRRTETVEAINAFKCDIANHFNRYDTMFDIQKSPEQSFNHFEDTLKLLKSKHLPETKVKFKRKLFKIQPYMTKDLLDGINFRDKLHRKYEKCKWNSPFKDAYKNDYTSFADNLSKAIRAAKKDFYHKRFNDTQNTFKKTWKNINDLLNRSKKSKDFPGTFMVNGVEESDRKEIANKMNSFFTGIGPTLADAISTENKPGYQTFLSPPSSHLFYFQYTDAEYIENLIMTLKNKNSQGIDGISTNLLKKIAKQVAQPLSYIVNQSFFTGIVPPRLKIARVIPLYKDNQEPDNKFENYRPISLLTALSKVFEKVVCLQLTEHLNTYGKFAPNQYGFRKYHSTEYATLELIDRLSQDVSNEDDPFTIFIDLSKAFDTLNHEILLHKLERIGIKNNKLDWFRSYLSDRSQYVDMNGTLSDTLYITTGVPQGSILGPILFLIYINDISKASTFFDFICYADDTTLKANISKVRRLCGSNDIEIISRYINAELEKVVCWLDVNKLSLNVKKTRVMLFHKSRSYVRDNCNPAIEIRGKTIQKDKEFDFLGFKLSTALTWNKHIEKISSKISKVNGVLSKLKYFLPRHTLITIYNSLVLPHLQYGITLWGSKCKKLEVIQKQCIRRINKVKRYKAHTDPLFKRSNLLKLEDIYSFFCLKIFYRYEKHQLPLYFDKMFPRVSDFHRYETSNSNDFYALSRKNTEMIPTIRYQIPFRISVKNINISKIYTHSLNGFSRNLKTCFIESYFSCCPIGAPNCYICSEKD